MTIVQKVLGELGKLSTLTCPPKNGPDVKLESGLNTGGSNGHFFFILDPAVVKYA